MRSGPGVSFGVVAIIYRNQVVTLIGRNADSTWVKIVVPNNVVGWVNPAYLISSVPVASLPVVDAAVPPAPGGPTAAVATGALNVRSGPDVGFPVLTVVTQGQALALLGRNSASTWAYVTAPNGVKGWVNASLITPTVPISSLPITENVIPTPAPLPTGTAVPPTTPTPVPAPYAVVVTGALNGRSGPDVAYNVVAVVHYGDQLQLIGRNASSSWAQLKLTNGTVGWSNASLLQPSVPISTLPIVNVAAPTPVATVITGALNVRSGPSVSYGVLAVVTQGQSVTVLGRNGNSTWAQIRTPSGVVGWVNASLIESNVPITSLPITG
jgi:uncharacterized protein YgiM (DUF1202 family)